MIVLIIGRQNGFSNSLEAQSNGDLVLGNKPDGQLILATNGVDYSRSLKADIEGAYGREVGIDVYGTVLLFATGVGIAGVFPFIKHLLEGYYNWNIKVRKLALF
jgi:NAD(P)H-flavin reductase